MQSLVWRRRRGDTSALTASQTLPRASNLELFEPFPPRTASRKQATIYFHVFFALAPQVKPAQTFHLNWETLSEGPLPGRVFGGGVDPSPSITPH